MPPRAPIHGNHLDFGFPYGETQTLTYGGITLTIAAENFARESSGENNLANLGYSRELDPEYEFRTQKTNDGSTYWTSPQEQSYLFEWSLWKLTQEQVYALMAMAERQRAERGAVRLRDQREVLIEKAPRARAKVGTTYTNVNTPDVVYFWPQFDIELLIQPKDVILEHFYPSTKAKYYKVAFSAREMNLVPPSQDI
jgi:hypothetical protein